MYLLVRPDGAKWWRLDFTLRSKRRTMGLGSYPKVDLAKARRARDKANRLIAMDIDPVAHRRTGAGEESMAFEPIARRWMEMQRRGLDPTYFSRIAKRFEDNVFPFIGNKDIRTIEPSDMLKIVRRMEGREVYQVGRRTNQHCSRIFKMAIAEGLTANNPCVNIVDAFQPQPTVKHRAAMAEDQIGNFLVKLADDRDEEVDTRDALMFTLLTVDRTDETRFAAKREFFGLDGDGPQWRIPASRMKMNLPHIVPLSSQAAALVRRRIELMRPQQELLFERRGTRSGVISENTMLFALYRLGYKGRATVHGFRSVFSTLANSATVKGVDGIEHRMWDPEWIERQLAHVEENQVRSAYNAAEYLPQRRRLLQWWADWLDQQEELARLIG